MTNHWKGSPRKAKEMCVMCKFLDWWSDQIPEPLDAARNWIYLSSEGTKDAIHNLKIEKFSLTHKIMCW